MYCFYHLQKTTKFCLERECEVKNRFLCDMCYSQNGMHTKYDKITKQNQNHKCEEISKLQELVYKNAAKYYKNNTKIAEFKEIDSEIRSFLSSVYSINSQLSEIIKQSQQIQSDLYSLDSSHNNTDRDLFDYDNIYDNKEEFLNMFFVIQNHEQRESGELKEEFKLPNPFLRNYLLKIKHNFQEQLMKFNSLIQDFGTNHSNVTGNSAYNSINSNLKINSAGVIMKGDIINDLGMVMHQGGMHPRQTESESSAELCTIQRQKKCAENFLEDKKVPCNKIAYGTRHSCFICKQSSAVMESWLSLGPIYQIKIPPMLFTSLFKDFQEKQIVYAHYNCLLYSEKIIIKKNHYIENINNAFSQILAQECQLCGHNCAGLKCAAAKCKRRYHYACAISDKINKDRVVKFFGNESAWFQKKLYHTMSQGY